MNSKLKSQGPVLPHPGLGPAAGLPAREPAGRDAVWADAVPTAAAADHLRLQHADGGPLQGKGGAYVRRTAIPAPDLLLLVLFSFFCICLDFADILYLQTAKIS